MKTAIISLATIMIGVGPLAREFVPPVPPESPPMRQTPRQIARDPNGCHMAVRLCVDEVRQAIATQDEGDHDLP